MTSWPNHSRSTRPSPKILTKCGARDSMSMRVSLTSKTRTDGRLCIGVATLLNYPGIAVGICEVCEARVVGPIRVGAEAETPPPLPAVDVLVSDRTDTD